MSKQGNASKSRVLFASALGSLVYLGLAILGWGGFAAFFAHSAMVALALILFVLVGAGLLSPGNLSAGEHEDRANRWVFIAFAIVGLLSGYVPAYTDRIGLWTLDGDAVRWTGVLFFAAGGALRIWPVFVLGDRFSGLVAIQAGHTLVTDGPYRIIRNPSYLGLLVSALGWSLAFRSGVGVLLAALYVPPLVARIHAEEALLQAHFGRAYDDYRARSWRLIPGLY